MKKAFTIILIVVLSTVFKIAADVQLPSAKAPAKLRSSPQGDEIANGLDIKNFSLEVPTRSRAHIAL